MSTLQGLEAKSQKPERPEYELMHAPDGRSWTARENLSDILARELLGPANGPEEVLEGQPDEAYLIGRIAPFKLASGSGDPVIDNEGEAGTDVGDAHDADQSRGVPVTAVDDSTAESDDESVEDTPQKRGLMVPASMGLRLQIPLDLAELTITASWGVYHPASDDEDNKDSRVRRFRRSPIAIPKALRVADLTAGQTTAIHLRDSVTLRIDRYDDTERGQILLEVALCNDKETPRKIPVDAWMYQTQLSVEAGGEEVFLPVQDVVTDTHAERDDELRRLNLQYRNRLEFAHGRTCSVDWELRPDARRAHKV